MGTDSLLNPPKSVKVLEQLSLVGSNVKFVSKAG
jgi:hypothetical protein